MSESTKETIEAIVRCVENGATVKSAIEAAYQMGRIEGGLEIMAIDRKHHERLQQTLEALV